MCLKESNEPCVSNSDAVVSKGAFNQPCPYSGGRGAQVGWLTVAALARGPIPRRQVFRLCPDSECEAVYYGSAGCILGIEDVKELPHSKKGARGMLCFCFQFRRQDLESEIEQRGDTKIPEEITSQIKAGNCACEVRNPTGRCCLGVIKRIAEELKSRRPGL